MTQRTLRSKKLRSLLYYEQQGKCALCGRDLPDEWHADHIEPWVKTQRTNVFEMQATCPACNRKKGAKEMPGTPVSFDWEKCRRGTKEALLTAIERFTAGEVITSINMPTRYGKTPTGRLLTAISTRGWITPDGHHVKPFACVNVWVTVNLILREQAASKKHWDKTDKIFGLSPSLRYGEIKDSYDDFGKLKRHARANNEDYLAINIHKIAEDLKDFREWVDHLVHTTGLPPIFHFDEAHLLSEQKPWGKVIAALIDAGARIAVWTATPRRSDGGIIPGFDPKLIGSEERKIKVLRDIIEKDGERFGIFDELDQKTSDYVLKAHVNIPFSEAWEEGYLLKPSYMTIDLHMSELDGETSEEMRRLYLSDLTPNTLRRDGIIGKAVRSNKIVREAVAVAYEHLMQWRRISPRAALVGFTVSDRDGGKNEHAEQIRREFLKHNPALKIVIATQKVEDAHDAIRNFEESDNDIILFKGMGGMGWDCARLQVVLDLGDDRQDATSTQKWMRGGTPWEDHNNFSLIVLADQLSKGILKRCIKDENGAATEKFSELIDTELRKLEDRKRNSWTFNSARQGDFTDSDEFVGEADDLPLTKALIDLMAAFRAKATDAALVHKAKTLGLTLDAKPDPKSIDQQIQERHDDIIDNMALAIDLMNMAAYNGQYERNTYGDMAKFLYDKLYKQAGINGDYVPVRKNRDLNQLTILDRQAQIILEEARDYAKINAR